MNALALPVRGVELLDDIRRMLGKGMSPVAIRRQLENRGVRRNRAEKCIALELKRFEVQDLYEGPEGRLRRYRHIGEQTIEDVLDGKITTEQANAVAGILRVLVKAEAAPKPADQPAPALDATPKPALVASAAEITAALRAREGAEHG